MAVTDPVDARLLAALAELGRTAVHELAARVGMDPREVAYRLVALSGTGLPLLVGVESDPNGLRAALAAPPPAYPGGSGPQGVPSGRYPAQAAPQPAPGAPSGGYAPPPATLPRPVLDPVISMWGPPQTASWARGDQNPAAPAAPRTGRSTR